MVTGTYRLAPKYKTAYVLEGMWTLPKFKRWAPSVFFWGCSAAAGILFFADSIPLYRQQLAKLPVIGESYNDAVDPEDSPF